MKNLIFILLVVFTSACNSKGHTEIRCICEFIRSNIEEEKIEYFVTLEGENIWREWGDVTQKLAGDYQSIEDCQVDEYLRTYNSGLGELKGQMIFVFLVHSFLKDGKIDEKYVLMEVDKLLDN